MGKRRALLLLLAVAAAAGVAACGSDSSDESEDAPVTSGAAETPAPAPPPAPSPSGDKAGEASPEASAEGAGEVSGLGASDEAQVGAAVTTYVAALNGGDGEAVCALFAPAAPLQAELPVDRGGCADSLSASIGRPPSGGAPAWRRTRIATVDAVSVGSEQARVTATVVHRFSDRGQPSIEEDVIYLQRIGSAWLLAKPSATLYRAVGYPEPPLRAFTPPR